MTTRMLIDARHREETRVAVIKGQRIEEFDFESADHRQIKGNIYLAKVTRVEPSLQAAFIEYGGNRHGFLAFSEIHPDYYQIPREDREALLRAEREYAAQEAEDRAEDDIDALEGDVEVILPPACDEGDEDQGASADEDEAGDDDAVAAAEIDEDAQDRPRGRRRGRGRARAHEADAGPAIASDPIDDGDEDDADARDGGEDDADDQADRAEDDAGADREDRDDDDHEPADAVGQDEADTAPRGRTRRRGRSRREGGDKRGEKSGDRNGGRDRRDAAERSAADEKLAAIRRRYKIQDVIRRRQVMLVQVVKEERGNKGAALTTYLSLAGRYCVLMPNTLHGGGISRKISSASDRKRLKGIIDDLALPPSMGCIVRTAGLSRSSDEIKRDFDYLARLWDEIREKTLVAAAPALVHTDSDLIKRAIRDIYHKEIEEVVVEGEEGYKAAREFMTLLMPGHANRVRHYADPVSLYQRHGVEDQLSAMLNPVVQLKSGGYIVINPTEALVSIDINSGRSTREHNIEQTALNTNLEAAAEIARQLRLRDMAGLIVIDFIDMDHGSNVRKVERAMKDALRNDRARIQIGRISGFGLMEMSRQRLRTGVLEASTRPCPHCEGMGLVRTASSAGLSALRLIEEEAARGRGTRITLRASQEATFYLLNEKRRDLAEIEALYGVSVEILPDGETEGARMAIDVSGPPPATRPTFAPIAAPVRDEEEAEDDRAMDADVEADADAVDAADEDEERQPGDDAAETSEEKRRRKRRRRGRRGRRDDAPDADGARPDAGDGDAGDARLIVPAGNNMDGPPDPDVSHDEEAVAPVAEPSVAGDEPAPAPKTRRRPGKAVAAAKAASDKAAKPARSRRAKAEPAPDAAVAIEAAEPSAPADAGEQAAEPAAEKPRRARARKPKAGTASEIAPEPASDARAQDAPAAAAAEPEKPKRASRSRKKAVEADAAPAQGSVDTQAMAGDVDSIAAPASDADQAPASEGGDDTPAAPKRGGWWQRTFG